MEDSAQTTSQGDIGTTYADGVPGVVYSYEDENFFHHRHVSFVNRPFPLEEADLHFQRLARWGCQCLRVLVQWEALEHAGPGIYDEEYIDYLMELLKVAAKYGLKCFLDPHVDCWSRFTGGSGMPGWTLELAGMDITKFKETLAATVHNTYPKEEKDNYPHMIWATNSFKTAAATMYTLFFSGQIFAPKAMVPLSTTVLSYLRKLHSTSVADEAYRRGVAGGTKAPSPIQNLIPVPRVDHDFIQEGMVNIQHYLQGHFMEAFAHLAERIALEDRKDTTGNGLIGSGTVMGFDSLNEPSPGYLNHFDLNSMLELADLQVGTCPTPIQGFKLAQGATVECQVWHTGALGPQKKGKVNVNEGKVNIWKRPFWKSNSSARADFNSRINPPSAPSPLRYPGGAGMGLSSPSPFDSISQLDIAPAPVLASAASMTTSMAEAQLSKTLWPEPSGYSDTCLWAHHNVWDPKTGELLQPNYFQRFPSRAVYHGYQPGKEIEWKQDFWLPFVNTFSLRLRQQDPRLTIFVEPPINEAPPMFRLNKILIGGAADHVRNMFRAMANWATSSSTDPSPDLGRNLYRSQHFRQFSRSTSEPQTSHHNSGNDPNSTQDATKSNGKGPKGHSRSENELFDNACENPCFDPIGDVSENVVVAPHFYDGYSNITRDFVPFTIDFLGYKRGLYWSVLGALRLGWGGVGKAWQDQVLGIQSDIRFAMGQEHAIIMGETGLPMDMHDKASFKNRYGAPKQSFALQLMLDAMDGAMMSYTLWNYCVDNSNQWGDRWNGEDFSVWCPPDSMFIEPEFQNLLQSPRGSSSTTLVQGSQSSLVSPPSSSTSGMSLKVISTEYGTGKETAGCSEGLVWWCCLPSSRVWTKRTAPRRVTVFAVEPPTSEAALLASESDPSFLSPSTATDSILLTATSADKEKPPPNPLTIESWQDLLPLSVQLERGRLDLYGGLRVGESFVRAYPLAVFGEPIMYSFEPGKPISTSDILGGRGIKRSNKTNDAPSWENRFRIIFRTDCGRPVARPSGSSSCPAPAAPKTPGKCEMANASNNDPYGQDGQGSGHEPSTDLFLPRYHFALTSTVGQDQFESLHIVHEMQQQQQLLQQHYQSSTSSGSTHYTSQPPPLKKSKWDKGRWNRFDVQVTDGRYVIQPSRQVLQYWTAPQPSVDPHDNLAPVAEMFERAEARIKALVEQQGWDGLQGVTTSSEQEWIKQLAAAVKHGEEAARRSVEPSLLTYVWPFTKCAGRPLSETEKEERIRLKYRELQQQWRDRIGLPAKGAAFCHTCGQLEVMHLHGVTVSLQMWSGYRG
ncbi:hypothetical protein BG005_002036 [Podila minutissima]|nr:hypothetical protein BG005_002036 [Podila minutissima]